MRGEQQVGGRHHRCCGLSMWKKMLAITPVPKRTMNRIPARLVTKRRANGAVAVRPARALEATSNAEDRRDREDHRHHAADPGERGGDPR